MFRQCYFTSLGLSLVTNVGIFLSHADHDTDVTWATDDGREDGAGSVITGEAGLEKKGNLLVYTDESNRQRDGKRMKTRKEKW